MYPLIDSDISRSSCADDWFPGAGAGRRSPSDATSHHAAADGRHVPAGPAGATRLLEQGGGYGVPPSGIRITCSAEA